MPKTFHNLVTISGIFGSVAQPLEEWQMSFSMGRRNYANEAEYSAFTAAVWSAYGLHIRSLLPNRTVATRVRIAEKNVGGLVDTTPDGAYQQYDDARVVPGTGSDTNPMPLQTACVISLVTDRAGATGRGRVFMPFPSGGLDSDYSFGPTVTANIADKWKLFFDAVNTAGEGAPQAGGGVLATSLVVASSKGYNTLVTGIRVGTIPDTMRSRRGAMVEGYLARPLA